MPPAANEPYAGRNRVSRLLPSAFLALTLTILLAFPAHAELIYPLDLPPSVSGNFGQYRHGHPHGGLDLWTGLRLDVPVKAVDDGVIFRIKVSPYGYGRALYQRLNDGRIAVYGHLAAFAPAIQTAVDRSMRRAGRYRLDWLLSGPEAWRVKQGDVIGVAGDAGTDVAHLHFELRGSDGRPVNPLRHGFPCPDTKPPALVAAHLEPLAPGATINGDQSEVFLPFAAAEPGLFTASETRVAGNVGLSVHAYDRIEGSPRELAPYDIRLLIDGAEHFRHRFDVFDYNRTHISALSYHQRLVTARRGAFIRLFRWHDRTVFHPTAQDGRLDALAPGPHRVTIEVRDEADNVVVGSFVLHVEAPGDRPTPRPFEQSARNGGKVGSTDGRARLVIPAGTLYAPQPLTVRTRELPAPAGLGRVGDAYDFGALWTPVKKKMDLNIQPPAGARTDRLGVYFHDRGTWWWQGAGTHAKVPLLGAFALLRDVAAPEVGGLTIGSGDTPTMRVVLWDRGSGIPATGINVTLDGRRQFVEYEPLKNQVRWTGDQPLSPGPHVVTVTVTDRAQNRTVERIEFTAK